MLRAAFQIQLGTAVALPIDARVESLHVVVETELLGTSAQEKAVDPIPLDHDAVVRPSHSIGKRVGQHLIRIQERAKYTAGGLSLTIIDLSGAPYTLCREPLLIELANAVARACDHARGGAFAILVPSLPAPGVFLDLLENFGQHARNCQYSVHLIANSGDALRFVRATEGSMEATRTEWKLSPRYVEATRALHNDVELKLQRKCIRMLGHYRSNPRPDGRRPCRRFSYYLHDCEEEIAQVYAKWWKEVVGENSRCVLFHLQTNIALRDVIVAHAALNGIEAERIEDVLASGELTAHYQDLGPAVLVLDAAETGHHAIQARRKLREASLPLTPYVFVGINKAGDLSDHEPLQVRGVVRRPAEPDTTPCKQCQLGLPHLHDGVDAPRRLRAYDFYSMVEAAGWSPERKNEAPTNLGDAYETLPNFGRILDEHGTWLAYKLAGQLKLLGRGSSCIVLHSNDTDAARFIQCLQDVCTAGVVPIQIPRVDIIAAQSAGNDWSRVLGKTPAPRWAAALPRGLDTNVVIIDIYNGSDSTAVSLVSLARQCHLSPSGYGCIVDLNPSHIPRDIAGVAFCSLYEWHTPRKLKRATA